MAEKIVYGFGLAAVVVCAVLMGYILIGDFHTEAVSTTSYTMTLVEKERKGRGTTSCYITVEDKATHKRQRFYCVSSKAFEEIVVGDKLEIIQKVKKNRNGDEKAYYEIKGSDIYLENEYTATQE